MGERSTSRSEEWALLSYRIPREPSTPRITIWRKLKRLGVAQIVDGLVALPADARTREHLDWIAEEVVEAGGTATVWLGRPASRAQARMLAETMRSARAAEYQAVLAQAEQAAALSRPEKKRVMRRLRSELRRISRRDYFSPTERAAAKAAVDALHPENVNEETA